MLSTVHTALVGGHRRLTPRSSFLRLTSPMDALVGTLLREERAAAASRQKSCNACVRGKRRCDKRTPRCTRCANKGLECVYQRMPPPQPHHHHHHNPSATATTSNTPTSSNGIAAASATAAATNGSLNLAGNGGGSGNACSVSSASSTTNCTPPGIGDVPDFDMGFDMDSLGTDTSSESMHNGANCNGHASAAGPAAGDDVGNLLGGVDFSIVDLMNASTGTGAADIWNLHPGYHDAAGASSKLDIPPLPSMPPATMAETLEQQQQQQQQSQLHQHRQPVRDLSVLKANEQACLDVDPLQVHDPRTRVGFIVSFLTNLHSTFAATRALPFIHPRLWATELPKTMLAAYAASAAYAGRSPANKAWAMRLLADAARDVHREGERAITAADRLARVQALTVLNSMRVFDGDVGMRAAAEREMCVMLAWVKDLELAKDELEAEIRVEGHRVGSREANPKSWESWIFLESARRSIMAAYAFMCVIYVLKSEERMPHPFPLPLLPQPPPPAPSSSRLWQQPLAISPTTWANHGLFSHAADCGMWSETQSFTASRHLWDATSSVEFYRSWRDKPQWWIENLTFGDFWQYGRPGDLDEFTRLMLTTQVGIDAMDHFMEGETSIPV
ncbi:C6 zinc finger domain-containingprotein [Purpureocillium lavendulum]|uniref:C6 zinc finger domain-containingprotein n=1 Tax=Purpureocillium lavendulum TaxID=1247861 RepID=A0AB34G298_9HYPO|nr:C6 zinc finger domain-containingprotein [Purpureocillium lavendulum]